jgi:hypothetical protein
LKGSGFGVVFYQSIHDARDQDSALTPALVAKLPTLFESNALGCAFKLRVSDFNPNQRQRGRCQVATTRRLRLGAVVLPGLGSLVGVSLLSGVVGLLRLGRSFRLIQFLAQLLNLLAEQVQLQLLGHRFTSLCFGNK